MNKIDKKILDIIKDNPKATHASIAKEVKMTASGVWDRIRRLEEDGTIKGYATIINEKKVGLDTMAFVFIKFNVPNWSTEISSKIAKINYVQEVYDVFNDNNCMVKIRAKSVDHLYQILKDDISCIDGVTLTTTTIVANAVKESPTFNIPS